jgi:hypothetical protein
VVLPKRKAYSPDEWDGPEVDSYNAAIADCERALAAAGVAVKEVQ